MQDRAITQPSFPRRRESRHRVPDAILNLSFPRRRESTGCKKLWIPAFRFAPLRQAQNKRAGMTCLCTTLTEQFFRGIGFQKPGVGRTSALPWITMLLLLLLAGCKPAPESDAPDPAATRPAPHVAVIAAVGDSLTAGLGVDESQAYPAQLEKKLRSAGYDFNVVNAGVSGETSSGTLSRIRWVISSLKPDIVILETGANDGLRGIDPDILRTNLDELITILQANDIAVILAGMQMLPNLGPEYTRSFSVIYPEIAKKHEIPLIPFFLKGIAGEPLLNQADGIHPTPEGYARVVETVFPYVVEAMEKRGTEVKAAVSQSQK